MADQIAVAADGRAYEDSPTSIKYYVKQFIHKEKNRLSGKTCVDFPAGNGVTSKLLRNAGAEVLPFDLFPEYFVIEGMFCQMADIQKGIPMKDGVSDFVLCQEGIEHFSDQVHALKEFNRILKKGGTLLITTPNYGNLRARLSYLLSESERFNKLMPPNELDSVWMSSNESDREIYYGHIFLIGIQKLRCIAKLAGFRISRIHFTRAKSTSLFLLPFIYPFIWCSNAFTYWRNMRKKSDIPAEVRRQTYGEVFRLSVNWKLLVDGHLFVEFEKENDIAEVASNLKSVHQGFGTT